MLCLVHRPSYCIWTFYECLCIKLHQLNVETLMTAASVTTRTSCQTQNAAKFKGTSKSKMSNSISLLSTIKLSKR